MARAPRLILIVDDAVELAEVFEALLEDAGYRVAVAHDGKEGLDLAASLRPDLVVLDMMMPEIDGLEFLARLPRRVAPPLPRVIALSGFDRCGPLALQRGAMTFVRKPVDPDELLSLIDRAFAGAALDGAAMREHDRTVDAAREAATRIRRHLWQEGVLLRDPLRTETRRLVEALASYFAMPKAAFKVVVDRAIYLVAQSSGPERFQFPEAVPMEAAHAFDSDVVQGGSVGCIRDANAHPTYADHAETRFGVRFWVAAPVLKSGVAVGTLCLVDVVPRQLRAEDLAVLGHFGEMVGARVGDDAGEHGPIVSPSGLFDREAFELLTNAALRRVERDGGTIGVGVARFRDTTDDHEPAYDRAARDLVAALGRERVVMAHLGPDTLAVAIEGADASEVQGKLASALAGIRADAHVVGAGVACCTATAGRAPATDAAALARAACQAERQTESAERGASRAA